MPPTTVGVVKFSYNVLNVLSHKLASFLNNRMINRNKMRCSPLVSLWNKVSSACGRCAVESYVAQ